MIKAPFNFVPLADKVYFPDWADKISQDMPFSDGMDGYLEIQLTAQTPVFVRNGHSKSDGENKSGDYKSAAVMPDGRFYLPATAVKGEIRNILEILSFGKMRVDDKAMFAQREWDNTDLYTIKNPMVQQSLCCGWLIRRGDDYCIRKSKDRPYRINHKRLDECLKTDIFRTHFSKDKGIDLNKEQKIGEKKYDPKTTIYKYKLLEEANIDRKTLAQFRFSQDPDFAVKYQENRVCLDMSGEISGTIVLTGQPDKANWRESEGNERQRGDGKFYEFVFCNEIDYEISLSKDEFDHFKFIYQDSDDWAYCKELLDGEGIPVFFRLQGKKIKDFGLAFLYKIPYEHSPYDLEASGRRYQNHSHDDADLADCIFGFARKQSAMKGRVHFSNFISENAEQDRDYTLVLNSPKASYYPIYIQQDGRNGVTNRYMTYNDGRLAGWKRYHVRNLTWEKKTGDPKLDTTIYPLKAGSIFKGRVYFHNLKPVELGALISAITFHGDSDHCYHQIGQAKPYGFGKLSVQLTKTVIDREPAGFKKDSYAYFLGLFEQQMNTIQNSWCSSGPIAQLITISRQEVTMNDVFDYMTLNMEGQNDFTDAKQEKLFLKAYSQLCNQTYYAPSYADKIKDLSALKQRVHAIREKKDLIRKQVEAKEIQTANELLNPLRSVVESLRIDPDYLEYQEEVDPMINGERAIDIEGLVPTSKGSKNDRGPISDSLADFKGKGVGKLFEYIGKEIKKGNTVSESDVDAIAEKCIEQITKNCKKQQDRDRWKDESKWKDLADALQSAELEKKVFEIVVSKILS